MESFKKSENKVSHKFKQADAESKRNVDFSVPFKFTGVTS